MLQQFLVAFLVLVLGAVLGRVWKNPPATTPDLGTFAKMLMDSEARLLLLTLIGLVVGVGATLWLIGLVLSKQVADAGIAAMIGTALGLILGSTVQAPWGYWFGSSKGSTDKTKALVEASADPK